MSLPLTREMLRGAYKFLCETPPFNRWNLPDADDVTFRVARDKNCHGWHDSKRTRQRHKHLVAVSSALVGHTSSLLATVAHEMVHVHEVQVGAAKSGVEHSAAFRRWAAQVCKYHGFDPKTF